MNEYSKKILEDAVQCAKKSTEEQRNGDGSVNIKLSNEDIREITNRKRVKDSLKNNIISDLKNIANAKKCDSESICITIPKEKIEVKMNKRADLKKQ